MRNGIHRRAAFNLSQIKRRPRRRGNFGINKSHRAAHQRVDRIHHPKIRPAMSARPADRHFQPSRSQRFRRDMIRPRPVQHNRRLQIRPVRIHQRAHPPQISFALFSHVGGKQNRAARLDFRRLHRPRNGHQRSQPRAIIRNPRPTQPLPFTGEPSRPCPPETPCPDAPPESQFLSH